MRLTEGRHSSRGSVARHVMVSLVSVALGIVGCGTRGPRMEFVEGTVLLDGTAVDGATVLFSPLATDDAGKAGLPAAGRTDAKGIFRLNAAGGARFGAGTKIGDYIVTVSKMDHDPVPPPDPNGLPGPPPNVKVWDVLPTVYKHATTTPLRATVKKGKNTFRFDLASDAKADPRK